MVKLTVLWKKKHLKGMLIFARINSFEAIVYQYLWGSCSWHTTLKIGADVVMRTQSTNKTENVMVVKKFWNFKYITSTLLSLLYIRKGWETMD